MKPEEIISEYERLIDTALAYVEVSRYLSESDQESARLSIKGKTATLSWKESESDYDGGSYLTTQSATFPVSVLSMTDDEIAAYAAEEERRKAEEEAARQRAIEEEAARFHAAQKAALLANGVTLDGKRYKLVEQA